MYNITFSVYISSKEITKSSVLPYLDTGGATSVCPMYKSKTKQ